MRRSLKLGHGVEVDISSKAGSLYHRQSSPLPWILALLLLAVLGAAGYWYLVVSGKANQPPAVKTAPIIGEQPARPPSFRDPLPVAAPPPVVTESQPQTILPEEPAPVAATEPETIPPEEPPPAAATQTETIPPEEPAPEPATQPPEKVAPPLDPPPSTEPPPEVHPAPAPERPSEPEVPSAPVETQDLPQAEETPEPLAEETMPEPPPSQVILFTADTVQRPAPRPSPPAPKPAPPARPEILKEPPSPAPPQPASAKLPATAAPVIDAREELLLRELWINDQLTQADRFYQNGDFASAIGSLRKIAERYPDSPDGETARQMIVEIQETAGELIP